MILRVGSVNEGTREIIAIVSYIKITPNANTELVYYVEIVARSMLLANCSVIRLYWLACYTAVRDDIRLFILVVRLHW